jgi:hypothetical protein
MVNKTRHKRKNTRHSKRLYGGLKDLNNSLSQYGQQQLVNYAANKSINNNLSPEYQQIFKNPMVNKVGSNVMSNYNNQKDNNSSPTLLSNLELIFKLVAVEGNQVIDLFIQNIGKELNIDLNQSSEQVISQIRGKIKGIMDMLNSEQGEALVAELTELFNESLSVFKPIVYQTLEEFNNALTKELKVLVRIANEAASEIPPVFLLEELSNLISTLVILLTSVAKIFPPIAEALDKVKSLKAKASNMQSNFSSLINQSAANQLQNISTPNISTPNISSNQLVSNPNLNNSVEIPSQIVPKSNMENINGGAIMKKLLKQRKMIGGSIEKSRADFLNPNLTLSQLIKPHKNKSRRK